MPEEIIHQKHRLSSFQIIISGFVGVILLGALLLMLPVSTTEGCITPFNETLFTATSAVCVTGLVVQDTGSMAAAPSSSIKNVPRRINCVSRTTPPTFGAEIASCMVLRCIREIFRPDSNANDAATVTTPSPPICISARMTAWPKPDQ